MKHAHFHASGPQRIALVASEPGVVAGIDLRDGNIAWRQVLPEGEAVAVLQTHGKGLVSVSVSPTGAYVRLWGIMGALVWDAHIAAVLSPDSDVPPPTVVSSGSHVVVAWQSSVRAFHGSTGELVWEKAAREGSQLAGLVQPPPAIAPSKAASTTTAAAGAASPPPPLHAFSVHGDSGELELMVLEADLKGNKGMGAKAPETLRGGVPNPAALVPTLDLAQLLMIDASGTKLLLHGACAATHARACAATRACTSSQAGAPSAPLALSRRLPSIPSLLSHRRVHPCCLPSPSLVPTMSAPLPRTGPCRRHRLVVSQGAADPVARRWRDGDARERQPAAHGAAPHLIWRLAAARAAQAQGERRRAHRRARRRRTAGHARLRALDVPRRQGGARARHARRRFPRPRDAHD